MTTMDNGRPSTAAGVLEAAAHWLDLADEAFAVIVNINDGPNREAGLQAAESKSVQTDLRMLATWLAEHPEIDAQMHTVLDVFPAQ